MNILTSSRDLRILKAHKTRINPNQNRITRFQKWTLDTTNTECLNIINKLHDPSDPTNWAIFDFKDFKKNLKQLIVSNHGFGGEAELAKNLVEISAVTSVACVYVVPNIYYLCLFVYFVSYM